MSVFCCFAIVGSVLLWSAWLVAALHEKGIYPVREVLDRWGRLGVTGKVIVTLFVARLAIYGSTKPSGTNGVDQVGSAFLGGCGPLGTTAPTVAVRPYRLESVSTNEGYSYAMPVGGSIRGTWHLTGAYEDVMRIGIREQGTGDSGWSFPLGNNLCTSLWAYTWGKVRPQLKNASNEIAAVGAPMSAIPEVSRFWTAATSNDTYLITWENFTLGRIATPTNASSLIPDPSSLVSAQLELKRNGDFITRSNDVECVYRRVNPDDWDDDGIPNEDDPEPLYHAEGETHFGPHQDLSVIINSNAYCWVDVVVPHVNARVVFVGEGYCRLPDPSFIAEAGTTNRVVILIGKEYHVFCDMPFEVVGKSDPEIEVWANAPTDKTICWPVEIEAWEGNGNSFRMHVVPNRVGGGFTWTNVCCSISGSGYTFSYGCDKDCLCTGCATSGFLEYEEFRKGCTGGSCGCSSWGEWVEDGDPDEAPEPASVSVDFSKSVVLFEEAYTNSYGQPVRGQSTVTRLTCVAYGGEHGGDLTFTLSGVDKLTRIAGVELPTGSVSVEPYQTRTYKVDYHGKEPSEGKGDITVSALLVENDTSENHSDEASMTAVKVWTYVDERSIPWSQRKEIGVGEKVKIVLTPNDSELNLSVDKTQVKDRELYYFAPSRARTEIVTVSASDCSLPLLFQTFEPTALQAVCYGGTSNLVAGVAGNMGMHFTVYVLPTNVSLSACHVMEEGCVATDPIGIFRLPDYADWLDHSLHGAGSWIPLNSGNWYHDDAFLRVLTNWGDGGSFTWPIPILWKLGDDGEPHHLQPSPRYDQRFEVDPDGTSRIRKFGYTIQQTTNLLYTVMEVIQ